MAAIHSMEQQYLNGLRNRLASIQTRPHAMQSIHALQREITRMEEIIGEGTVATAARNCVYEVFQESMVTNTTIDISIDVFTLALLFPILQTNEGQKLVREILQKTVPPECTISEDAVLNKVEARGHILNFELVATHKMLKVPNPRLMPAMENFVIPMAERDTRPSHDQSHPLIRELAQGIKAVDFNPLSNVAEFDKMMAASWVPYTTTSTGTVAYPFSAGNASTPLATAVPKRKYGQAATLLDAPNTAVSDGSYLIFRTNLDSYHLYSRADGKDEPGEKLYVAVDLNDLGEAIDRLRREAESAAIRDDEFSNFECDLMNNTWYSI